jgi:hypothetical protein
MLVVDTEATLLAKIGCPYAYPDLMKVGTVTTACEA